MAAVVNNYAKGRGNEFINRIVSNDPANSALVIVMLKTAEANSALLISHVLVIVPKDAPLWHMPPHGHTAQSWREEIE